MKDLEELARKMRDAALQKSAPQYVYEKVYEPSEEQKKMFYHAGRFAAGARDYTARKAYEKLTQMGEL